MSGEVSGSVTPGGALTPLGVRERIALSIEAAWDEQCSGYRNPDVCESCRAYEDAVSIARGSGTMGDDDGLRVTYRIAGDTDAVRRIRAMGDLRAVSFGLRQTPKPRTPVLSAAAWLAALPARILRHTPWRWSR